MSNHFNKAFFAFMARLAIICNAFFIITLMHMLYKWVTLPDFLANFVAVLGLIMSPIANICFILWLFGIKLTKSAIEVPKWQTILIVFMLLVQIGAAIL
jgi:hypothetical protein